MKKFLAIISFAIAFGFTSCHPGKTVVNDGSYGASISHVQTLKPDTLTEVQMDSLVKADKLPAYSRWNTAAFKDDESHTAYEYKSLYNSKTGVVYTGKLLKDGRYVVRKRLVSSH